jgi:DNA anti-recombination protein RmuC
MGEWKAPLSLRVRQALRVELEAFASREKRTLGNIGELILEWAFEQLKTAGSTERLLQYKIRPSVKRSPDNLVERHKL